MVNDDQPNSDGYFLIRPELILFVFLSDGNSKGHRATAVLCLHTHAHTYAHSAV